MQYKKIFNTSEIEYITPFFKLWMSFNNWYKQDLSGITKDSAAINHYKSTGKIKDDFLKLFNLSSETGLDFQNALYELVLNIGNYELKYPNGDIVNFDSGLILENADGRGGKEPIFISSDKKRFQILEEEKEKFFEQTLNIIYQVRCTMVHGDYDIDNTYFLKLVESSYKILYPILERIIKKEGDGEFICISVSKNVNAIGLFDNGKMTILQGSKVSKTTVSSYTKTTERNEILETKGILEDSFYFIREQIEFNSPSAASSFCLGVSSNGWDDWKDKTGKTMGEILRNN